LSGWLDSSLVCGVAARLLWDSPLHTFTIGMDWWTDLEPARLVAKHIWSIHHEFLITPTEALEAIDDVIRTIESRDTTTIRASVFQYLLGKYIANTTDIKVLLTGEWADELMWGYMYTHKAPDAGAFDEDCKRLLRDIYLFDGLRVDRSMARWWLEVRIPFLDMWFVEWFLELDPEVRQPQWGREKYALRKAFADTGILPDEVLRRKKKHFLME
jgi:asparagine synthase (glutamine-hydrolysing)